MGVVLFELFLFVMYVSMDFIIEPERIFAQDAQGKVIAEVTFPVENCIATIDHTFVDESLRGQGVASRLVQLAADKILADGHKIAATCPYAVTWLQRHPQYQVADNGAPVACSLNKLRGHK